MAINGGTIDDRQDENDELRALAGLFSLLAAFQPHGHKCSACGNLWSHREADINSSDEWDRQHTCSQCGQLERMKCEVDGSPLRD